MSSDSYNRLNNKITTLDLSNFDTSNVVSMKDMFSPHIYNRESGGLDGYGEKLQISKLDLSSCSNVTNMSSMFYGCSVLVELHLCSFNLNNVTSAGYYIVKEMACLVILLN